MSNAFPAGSFVTRKQPTAREGSPAAVPSQAAHSRPDLVRDTILQTSLDCGCAVMGNQQKLLTAPNALPLCYVLLCCLQTAGQLCPLYDSPEPLRDLRLDA
jgi:hypothetical protein